MPATNKKICHSIMNKHFGATSSPMKRGNHEVAVIGPDDLKPLGGLLLVMRTLAQ
jgi:hypothetical protein